MAPENQTSSTKPHKLKGVRDFFAALGPGLVTGAADDDPSGILTYSQSGAQYGFGQLWTALFMLPMMIATQELAARIGVITNKGIAKVIKQHYSKPLLYFIVALLLIANTINLGADLGAMAESARLIVNLPFYFYILSFFFITLLLEIFVPYRQYSRILKWLSCSLLAYILTGLIISADWRAIVKATFVPHISLNTEFLFIITGVLGTTISPYMFFWQASQEIEEKEERYAPTYKMSKVSKSFLKHMRLDTFYGMLFSEITTWFIIITTAEVLYSNGIHDISTAAQAASAFTPLVHTFPYAGKISEVLFAFGIIGTGLLAIPIFAAVSSYAIAEIGGWREGLANTFSQARGFYAVIALGTFIGLLMNFFGVNPIKMLIYTAVINGIMAIPMILIMIHIGNNPKIMGSHTSGRFSNALVGITFAGMALAGIYTLYGLFAK